MGSRLQRFTLPELREKTKARPLWRWQKLKRADKTTNRASRVMPAVVAWLLDRVDDVGTDLFVALQL